MTELGNLPPEILFKILLDVDPLELKNMCGTSSNLRRFCDDDIFKSQYQKKWESYFELLNKDSMELIQYLIKNPQKKYLVDSIFIKHYVEKNKPHLKQKEDRNFIANLVKNEKFDLLELYLLDLNREQKNIKYQGRTRSSQEYNIMGNLLHFIHDNSTPHYKIMRNAKKLLDITVEKEILSNGTNNLLDFFLNDLNDFHKDELALLYISKAIEIGLHFHAEFNEYIIDIIIKYIESDRVSLVKSILRMLISKRILDKNEQKIIMHDVRMSFPEQEFDDLRKSTKLYLYSFLSRARRMILNKTV